MTKMAIWLFLGLFFHQAWWNLALANTTKTKGDIWSKVASCQAGVQSPQPLKDAQFTSLPEPPILHLEGHWGEIVLEKHQVKFIPTGTNEVYWQGHFYQLQYLTFRLPAEHHITSKADDVEWQWIYQDQAEAFLVLSSRGNRGQENPALENLLQQLPTHDETTTQIPVRLKVSDFAVDGAKAYVYEGSMTQPPCQQPTIWILSDKTTNLSANQWFRLKKLIGYSTNARPVQLEP